MPNNWCTLAPSLLEQCRPPAQRFAAGKSSFASLRCRSSFDLTPCVFCLNYSQQCKTKPGATLFACSYRGCMSPLDHSSHLCVLAVVSRSLEGRDWLHWYESAIQCFCLLRPLIFTYRVSPSFLDDLLGMNLRYEASACYDC